MVSETPWLTLCCQGKQDNPANTAGYTRVSNGTAMHFVWRDFSRWQSDRQREFTAPYSPDRGGPAGGPALPALVVVLSLLREATQ